MQRKRIGARSAVKRRVVFGLPTNSLSGRPKISALSLRNLRNAFAFRAACEVNEAATVAAVSPKLQAGAFDDEERLLLRAVGNLLQTDAQSSSHSTLSLIHI